MKKMDEFWNISVVTNDGYSNISVSGDYEEVLSKLKETIEFEEIHRPNRVISAMITRRSGK